MPAKPKVLITDATGQVGALVTSYLKADSSVEVIAAARSLEKAKGLGIPSVYLDLDKPESLATALEGVERAFLATGYTIDMGYEALTYDEIAEIFTKVLGQHFSYEARPPEEFYENVLAAGAEPAYMKCVFNSYSDFTAGRGERVDETFDNLPTILGRQPKTMANFGQKNADSFRY